MPLLRSMAFVVKKAMEVLMQDYGTRPDGSRKGKGWLGPLKSPNGHDVTEYTIGVPIGGKEMDIPSVVPTLTKQEIAQVLSAADNGEGVPDAIRRKAIAHAEMMVKSGKSVFAPRGGYSSKPMSDLMYISDMMKGIR